MHAIYVGPLKVRQVEDLILVRDVPVPIPPHFCDEAGLAMLKAKFDCVLVDENAAVVVELVEVPLDDVEPVVAHVIEDDGDYTAYPAPPPKRRGRRRS